MEYHIKLTKKSNRFLKSLQKDMGHKTQSETINLAVLVGSIYHAKNNVLFKGSDNYLGNIKYHYRPCEYVTSLTSKKETLDEVSEFINFHIELFNHWWGENKK